MMLYVSSVCSPEPFAVDVQVFLVFRKRGMKTRIRRLLFKLTLLMFGYATIYMAVSIMNVIVFIKGYFLDVEARGSPAYEVLKMFSAIGLINVSRT